MLNYEPININDKKIFEDIIKSKHKDNPEKKILNNGRNIIIEAYENYKDKENEIEKINHDMRIESELKNALIKTYESNGKVLSEMKNEILEKLPLVLQGTCPYCMISEPNTFDHYLDKSSYPEFSIYSRNLIPCCSRCNSYKGDKVLNDIGEREFINFGFDKLPNYCFLKIEVKNINGHPSIGKIHLKFQDENRVNKVITRHFEKLHLIERYKKKIPNELSCLYNELKLNDTITVSKLENILKKKISVFEENQGRNNWLVCLYRGILENKELLSDMCQ